MISPLTGRDDAQLVTRIDPSLIRQRWQTELGVDISHELVGIDMIEKWRCPTSGLLFYTPSSAAGSAEMYRLLEQFDWYYQPAKWEYEESLKWIDKSESILDIGCGVGRSLSYFQSQGYKNVKGLETTPSAVQIANTQGLDVILCDSIQYVAEHREQFDIVTAQQVLEHIPNPLDFLRSLFDLTKPGGKVIIGVPNPRFLGHQYDIILDMPPHHMSHWPVTAFQYLTQLFPCRLLALRSQPFEKILAGVAAEGMTRNLFGTRIASSGKLNPVKGYLRSLFSYLPFSKRFLSGHTHIAIFQKST